MNPSLPAPDNHRTMRLTLSIRKTIEQNAAVYFEEAKRARKRIEGVKKTIARYREQEEQLLHAQIQRQLQMEERLREQNLLKARLHAWYHTFRWFVTSDGFLVVGGRDSTSNEVVIKKHAHPGDLVLHTDMAGSPFFVIQSNGRTITETAKRQAADATCTFSRAWKTRMQRQRVFCVEPRQLSKTGKSGEYVPKGAFVVTGKVTYLDNHVNLAVGTDKDGFIMAGPSEAVSAHCSRFIELQQGDRKPSDIAKQIRHELGGGDLDEIIRALPAGGFSTRRTKEKRP